MASSARLASIRNLANSPLWQGVPQMTLDNIRQYDPAYTGHTFLFVTHVPLFMEKEETGTGKFHSDNLKALIERASTSFSGPGNKVVNFSDQQDGYSNRKLSFATSVVKDIDTITIRMHEFKGLVLKNALEYWVDGIFDEKSQHAHYYGQVESMEFSIKNHTMGMLTVQVDPSWFEIQDSAWYYNMTPVEVPFDHFNWTKGEANIVEDLDIQFKCNEERSAAVNAIAIKYMNNKIISNLNTGLFDRKLYDPRIPSPA